MAENLLSGAITLLDATPIQMPSAGEGAPGMRRVQFDQVASTTALAVNSSYRMSRFPVEAKVKRVWLYTKGVDSNVAATAKFDVNVAFSDSTTDGTPPALQAQIPTSALTGATTSLASYASPNKLFGSAVPVLNSGAFQMIDVTFKNTYLPENQLVPLWSYLGFVNNAGQAQSPGGNFDILLVVNAGAATVAAGDLAVEVDFVI